MDGSELKKREEPIRDLFVPVKVGAWSRWQGRNALRALASSTMSHCDARCRNRNSAGADHFEGILPHYERSIVVDPDAENIRMRIDDIYQLSIAFRRRQVRIDRNVRQETEPRCFSGRH